ncbi:Metallo-dependent phosphatase-like protein, partial [Elsinoe ampelina]
PIKLVCVSDTHNAQTPLPAGDILIHAGDLTQKGTASELQAQLDWINRQPHHHKIVIAGNHDMLLDLNKTPGPEDDKSRKSLTWGDIHYLHNESITLRFKGGRALSVYGNPWTRKHGNWAFQYLDSYEFWRDRIPDDTDVLVTHMPPQCHLDLGGEGDPALLQELRRVKPMLHVFGHFHASAGVDLMVHDGCEDAFEEVVRAGGGVGALLRFVRALVGRAWGLELGAQTVLVNASYVGGYLDEKRRAPVEVRI